MFILDKDGITIVNVDNVTEICAFNFLPNGKKIIRVYTTQGQIIELGEYSTNRAIDILEEIMKKMEVGARIYELPND